MEKIELRVGDLVQHTRNERFGIVMSPSSVIKGDHLSGLVVCKVIWIDTDQSNLMQVDYLKKIKGQS